MKRKPLGTLILGVTVGTLTAFTVMAGPATKTATSDREKLKQEIKQEVLAEMNKKKGDSKESSLGSFMDDKIKFSGQVRVRPEFRRNLIQALPNIPGAVEEDTSVLLRTRFGLQFNPVEHIGFFIQGQDSRDFGEEVPPLATPGGDDEGIDLHQGYIDITQIGGEPYSVRVGRQEIKLGNERLVGAGNWFQVGRSFDGMTFTYDPESWRLVVLAALTDKTGVTNLGDAQYFGGIYGTWKGFPGGVLDGYYFLLQDNDGAVGAAAGTGDTQSVHTVGVHLQGAYESGIDFDVESAVQLGKFGSNSIFAHAHHLAVGYTFKPDWKPRIGVEYNFATGNDPATAKYTKFNNLFPTNHDKYGLMDLTGWSNMHDGAIGFSVKPGKFHVDTKYHLLMVDKNESAGDTFATYAGAAGIGKVAGHELDLSAKWTMNKYFELGAGISHLIPGAYFKDQGMTDSADFFYLSAQAQFN